MEQEKKTTDPEFIYGQSLDKQRIVITGSQAKMITALILHVLKNNHREFDYATQVPLNGASSASKLTDAPVIIIQGNERPTLSILKYQHHIAVISDIAPADEDVINQFADATPKAGTIIISETESTQRIGKKERPDTTTISYKTYAHAFENGKVLLISSTNLRFPIKLSGEPDLRSISAAKEVVKKLGITSEQFYQAVSGFEG